MPKDYSPFTPGQPVPVEFFVGRLNEVTILKNMVASAANGRLKVAFLLGERGIGKSSLASFVRNLSERDTNMLGLHTFLGGVTSLEEVVRRIFDRFLKVSIGKSWYDKVKEFFGEHIQQVGLLDISVEFKAPSADLKRLVNDFTPALRNLINRLKGEKSGLFLIVDDINGLAGSADFSNWLKSLVDEIATGTEPMPLCLLFVGLEERRQSLISLQPSLARVFELIEIHPWSKEETVNFYRTAFSKVDVTIEDDVLNFIARYTGGLPVLAHEIGDAVFKIDQDNHIDRNDALQGIIVAADIVGRKHLEPQVLDVIRSARYRTILRKITATPFEITFGRSDLRSRLSLDENKVLDNFLAKMKKLGVIKSDPNKGPGAYRFSNSLHYLYFWLEAERAKGTEIR